MKLFNTDFILSDRRHGWIDYDRGISIILVTYRHCYESMEKSGLNMHEYPWLEYINVFFFGFRMPLFFIASGMFISGSMKKIELQPYVLNRIKSILYPLLVWGIIQISLQLIFSDYTNSKGEVDFHSYIYLITYPRATGQFWYLNALFFVGVIYAVLKSVFKFTVKYQIAIGVIFYFSCSYLIIHDINVGAISDILKYYLFFAIGDAISDFMLSHKTANLFTSRKFIIPLLILFIIIQYIFTQININNGSNYFVENKIPIFFLLVALVGCALSIAVSFSLKKHEALKFIRVIGYNSVHIYCLQIIVMSISRLVFIKIFGISNVPLLAFSILFMGLFVPMVVYNVCLRMNLWWLFTLKKPEAEISAILGDSSLK